MGKVKPMDQILMYVLPAVGLGAGIFAWFTKAQGKNALNLLAIEGFGFVIMMFGG